MGTHKVLVIDEEKSSVSLFGKALEPRGIDVFVMGMPDKGIEKAIEIEPDLIFVNLIFQESNGLKVSKLIHAVEKLRKVPIIMLLAHKSDLDPKYTTTIGVVGVLIRPFTTEDILAKTLAVLGIPAAETAAEEEIPDVMPAEAELQQTMVVDDTVTAFPEWAGADSIFDSGSTSGPDSEYEQDFVDEADKLIDQSIINPGDSRKTMFDLDHNQDDAQDDVQPRDDVIHLRRPEEPKAVTADRANSDDKFAEEIAMEERDLFDEDADRKKAAMNKSFEDELEESEKEKILRHGPSEDAGLYEGEVPEEEKPGSGKKIMLTVVGVVLIAGLGLGAYVVKKTYFRDETVRVSPPAEKKEVVTENLPPAGAVNAPEKPATSAVPAPVAIPVPPPAQKEQEKPKAAPAKPAEQKPVATSGIKEVEKANAAKEKASIRFAVQAGYFESEKNAEAMVDKLKGKGYEAYILKNEASGKGTAKARTFYRVLIGKFDSGKKAAAYAREMKQKDNLSVVVYRQ